MYDFFNFEDVPGVEDDPFFKLIVASFIDMIEIFHLVGRVNSDLKYHIGMILHPYLIEELLFGRR